MLSMAYTLMLPRRRGTDTKAINLPRGTCIIASQARRINAWHERATSAAWCGLLCVAFPRSTSNIPGYARKPSELHVSQACVTIGYLPRV